MFRKFIFYITAFFLVSGSLYAGEPMISAINIHSTAGTFLKTDETRIRNVIPLHVGDRFTLQKLDESLNNLRQWGIFEDINVRTAPVKDGIDIDFYLQEAVLIGEINVQGNYPYVERKIKKYLTIRAGDIYTDFKRDEQIKRIEDFYSKEGFFNTRVSASEEWNEFTGDVAITFKIKRGSIVRYRNISVSGCSALPAGRITSAINPLKRYRPRALNEAVRRVEDYYRYHGYPRIRIKIEKKDFDFEKNRLDLAINVSEGPHVKTGFTGNKALSSSRLRKALTIYDEGSFDEFEIEQSVEQLLKLYKKHGFDKTKITYKSKTYENGDVLIVFSVDEGPILRVSSIEFEGRSKIGAAELRRQMRLKEVSLTQQGVFNESELAADVKNLKKYYDSRGYLSASIGKPLLNESREGLNVVIPVHENGQTTVENIVFGGAGAFSDRRLSKKVKSRVKKPFDPDLLEKDKQSLAIFYKDHGYPYAEISSSVEQKDDTAVINFNINEGSFVKIGEILVVGNSLTATRSIQKAVSLKRGDPYSEEKIIDSQLALRRMGAFSSASIRPIGLEEKESIVHLKVKVEEAKPFMLDFSLGYSTDQLLVGSMTFTNLNSFGRAKRSNLALTGGRRLSKGELSFIDPRFLGTDLETNASTWLQYEDKIVYNYIQAGGGYGIYRRYHRTGLMAKYELLRNYFIKGDSTAADADSLRDNTLSKITLSASFDTRNSFADPTRGIFTMFTTSINNEVKGAEANFIKYRWSLGDYYGFFKYFNLINTLRFDQIQTIGSNVSVPSNELFLLGGDDTLRGFSQSSLGPVDASGKPTGGRMRWIYNAELHIKIIGNFKLAGFFDAGELVNDLSELTKGNIRDSAGFGLRYFTPVGPLKFDYGIVLDRRPGEDFGRFHFTFGYIF